MIDKSKHYLQDTSGEMEYMATTASGCLASEGSQWRIATRSVGWTVSFLSWDIGHRGKPSGSCRKKKCNTYWKNEEKNKENKER
jgi:hypothetical protein